MFMSAFTSPSVLSVSPAPIFSSSLSGLSPAVCKAFFLRFCSATLSPSVSRISLTSRASLPFKWGGLPLKGLRGCSPCKAYTHTADAPHPCPPSIWAPVKKKKIHEKSPVITRMRGEECAVLKDFGCGGAVWNSNVRLSQEARWGRAYSAVGLIFH